jgi:hypothetical protein
VDPTPIKNRPRTMATWCGRPHRSAMLCAETTVLCLERKTGGLVRATPESPNVTEIKLLTTATPALIISPLGVPSSRRMVSTSSPHV